MKKISGFSGNVLKLFAALTMTIDHIGVHLFPGKIIFRIIGRLAFPIFAYMLAEGAVYTKNRKRYIGTIALFALILQIVYTFVTHSLYQCIFVTLFLSLVMIFTADKVRYGGSPVSFITAFAAIVFVSEILPALLPGTDFGIDYGLFGIMLPVFAYFGNDKKNKLALFTAGLVLLSLSSSWVQWFCLFSVPIIALYNGRRGRLKMKYFFYIYYPAHLCVIYVIKMLIH